MSITAAATALGLLGRLIFDIVKWANEDTADAEKNRELPKDKKHTHVEQLINHKIDNYDLRDEHALLLPETIKTIKEEARKHVNRHIKDVVKTKHDTGEFVRS
jgi:DNA helicase TIP49 (TBP-interacting protein)